MGERYIRNATVTSFLSGTNSTASNSLVPTSTIHTRANMTYFEYYNPGTPFDIAMDCLLISALVFSFYLLLSLVYYEWHMYKYRKVGTTGNNKRFNIASWLRVLCILSAFFTFMRCLNDIVYYKEMSMSDTPCTVLKNMGVSWLIEVDTAVYLFLWLRQRVLYRNKNMRRMESPLTLCASWLALIIIVAIFILMNAALLLWRVYTFDPIRAKCVAVKNPIYKYIPKTWVASSTALHIILVALYVYPLLRQTSKIRERRRNLALSSKRDSRMTTIKLKKQASTASKGRKSLLQVVVQCVVISLVCVITDGIAIAVTSHWIVSSFQTKLRHFIYNLNALINVVAIVTSFTKWRRMISPYHTWRNFKSDKSYADYEISKNEFASTTISINANVINRVK